MMKQFRSVQIIHDIIHRVDFSYLAELFRFMGIFVCEDILVEKPRHKSEIERNTHYSAYIYVGKHTICQGEADMLHCSVDEYRGLVQTLPEKTIFWYDYFVPPILGAGAANPFNQSIINAYTFVQQKMILKSVMSAVLATIFSPQDHEVITAAQLQDLIDIYVDRKLWFHSMNMQYFPKRKTLPISDAKTAFFKSHEDLKKVLEARGSTNERFLYEYALLWCEVKTNNACSFGEEILFFTMEKLVDRCKKLCEKYPDFSNAKVLLGMCYEPSTSSVNEALWAFEDALQDIKSECFSSPVYYWIGKRYESYSSKAKEAETSYTLANQSKIKFRNNFKLAIFARDAKQYDKALELFKTIPSRLSLKKEMNFNDPLELEYLFKSYTQQCYIYHEMEQYAEAIDVGEKAIDIIDRCINSNLYFTVFYGNKDAFYRDLLKERLSANMVYWLLVDCYDKLFEDEKAEEYRLKAKECNNKI